MAGKRTSPAAWLRDRFTTNRRLGAMLSQLVCNLRKLCKITAKACEFAKPACFRGDQHWLTILQTIRESMAPVPMDWETVLSRKRKVQRRNGYSWLQHSPRFATLCKKLTILL